MRRPAAAGLRTEIDEAAGPVGVLIVADGVHTSPPAPGGYDRLDPGAGRPRRRWRAVTPALTRLPYPVVGRVAYQVLAGLAGPSPRSAKELYRGAPYGVGYFAGVWHP